MQLSVFQCFLCALWYWFINMDLGSLGRWLGNATFNGVLFGFLFGKPVQGTIIGATINIMYISTVAVGANLPADDSLAAVVAIPIALASNMDPQQAVLLATPFGVLGTFVDNVRRMLNGYWNRKAHKDVAAGKYNLLPIDGFWGPFAVQFVVRVPIAFVIMLSAARGTEAALSYFPAWVLNAFSVIGGILPGFGIVLCATFVGKNYLLPFFILGFFLARIWNMSTLVAGIFGACFAIIYVKLAFPAQEGEAGFDTSVFKTKLDENAKFTDKELNVVGARIMLLHRFDNCLESLYGTGVGWAMYPALKKVYADDEEGLKDAVDRHLLPYITEMALGGCIMGAALAMEEQIAAGETEITGDDIVNMKSSLMGPFAGFGDSLLYSTIAPLIRTVLIPFALEGSVIVGLLMEFSIRVACVLISMWSFKVGYKAGKRSILAMLRGGIVNKLMTGAGVMGMFVLGAMGSSYCKLSLKLTTHSEIVGDISVQQRIDGILPGLLPFLMMMGVYRYFQKGGQYLKLIVIVLVACLVLSFLKVV